VTNDNPIPLPRSAHSPLPWTIRGTADLEDADGGWIACTRQYDGGPDAALIVESVNAHASLVERVKELDGALREALDLFEMQEREGRETFSPDGILPKLRALAALGRAK